MSKNAGGYSYICKTCIHSYLKLQLEGTPYSLIGEVGNPLVLKLMVRGTPLKCYRTTVKIVPLTVILKYFCRKKPTLIVMLIMNDMYLNFNFQ